MKELNILKGKNVMLKKNRHYATQIRHTNMTTWTRLMPNNDTKDFSPTGIAQYIDTNLAFSGLIIAKVWKSSKNISPRRTAREAKLNNAPPLIEMTFLATDKTLQQTKKIMEYEKLVDQMGAEFIREIAPTASLTSRSSKAVDEIVDSWRRLRSQMSKLDIVVEEESDILSNL